MPEVPSCPRCGGDSIAHGYSFPPAQGTVECHSDGCGAIAVADTEAEAISMWSAGRWNYRIADYDEDGQMVIVADAPTPTI